MLQNIHISDKCCSSDFIHQRNLKINSLIIIMNVSCAANQNIIMISEGSCDWSNDAKNTALKSQE